MDLDEFLAEEAGKQKPIVTKVPDLTEYGIMDNDILPINVYQSLINGELVYMVITEDGRSIRLDEM